MGQKRNKCGRKGERDKEREKEKEKERKREREKEREEVTKAIKNHANVALIVEC